MSRSPHSTGETSGDDKVPSRSGGWLFPALLAVVLVIAGLVSLGNRPSTENGSAPEQPASWSPSPQPAGEVVRLEIDFSNGASKRFEALPWKSGMTVGDVMNVASEFQPGISFQQIGEEEGGFLTSLDGLKNEGAGGRNWTYEVDSQSGKVSFCVKEVEPGELIRWTFANKPAEQ